MRTNTLATAEPVTTAIPVAIEYVVGNFPRSNKMGTKTVPPPIPEQLAKILIMKIT